MRMISLFRGIAVALVIGGWFAFPSARGLSLEQTLWAGPGYLAATLVVVALWRRRRRPTPVLFGLLAMADSAYLAWSSYVTAGLDSPLRHLIVVQIITFSLLASFRTGLKLVFFNACLLLSAAYLQETGALDALGGDAVHFWGPAYEKIAVELGLFLLAAVATTTFAAVNERELRRRRYDLEALARFALALEAVETPDDVAATMLDAIAQVYDCDSGVVVHGAGAPLRALAVRGEVDPALATGGGEGLLERSPVVALAIAEQRSLLVSHRGEDDAILAAFGPRANVMIIPVRERDGTVVGAVVVRHPVRHGSRVERRVLSMVERFVSHGSLALANACLLEEVRDLAITDGLTGLPNRRHLDELLERVCAQSARGHGALTLLMVDIDHFKRLNDTYGHQVGDEVLRLVARTLDESLRAGDIAARYGGEEFCVVMPGATGAAAVNAAERLRAAIERASVDPPVTASVGVAFGPLHGQLPVDLTEAADAALYAAKRAGRNRVMVAEPAERPRLAG